MSVITLESVANNGTVYSGSLETPDKPAPIPNPGYFRALKLGKPLPIGNWHREITEVELHGPSSMNCSHAYYEGMSFGSYVERSISGDIHWPGYWHYANNPPCNNDVNGQYFSLTALKNEAVNRAKNSAWDVATFAAEADKTYDLVRHAHNRTFQRAWDIFGRYGGKWGRGAAAVTAFASAWMEYRYGWRILMYDLEAAQDSVQHLRDRVRSNVERGTAYQRLDAVPRKNYSASTTTWQPGSNLSSQAVGFAGLLCVNNGISTLKREHRVGAGVESLLASSFTINPLLTAWELVPFSFVVDWFVDVGNMVGASTPTLGRNLAYVWHSVRSEYQTTMTTSWGGDPDLPSYLTWKGDSGTCSRVFRQVTYDRYVSGFTPWTLNFNPQLTLGKFTDLAALVRLRNNEFIGYVANRR